MWPKILEISVVKSRPGLISATEEGRQTEKVDWNQKEIIYFEMLESIIDGIPVKWDYYVSVKIVSLGGDFEELDFLIY